MSIHSIQTTITQSLNAARNQLLLRKAVKGFSFSIPKYTYASTKIYIDLQLGKFNVTANVSASVCSVAKAFENRVSQQSVSRDN